MADVLSSEDLKEILVSFGKSVDKLATSFHGSDIIGLEVQPIKFQKN